jgi:glycosyltransferase involved in cell wall biosynthesis
VTRTKLSIFISHPSHFLTDHEPHGDGLLAFQFIDRLARRGHTLHVAVQAMSVRGSLPANVTLYPAERRLRAPGVDRLEYMLRARRILRRVQRAHHVDLVHQLNPVMVGLSLSMAGTGLPTVLGPFVPAWAPDATGRGIGESLKAAAAVVRRPLAKPILYLQQRAAAALLVSTPAALTRLARPDAFAARTHALPFGIDEAVFSPAGGEREAAEAEPSILFLANLEPHKGIFALLDAFECVAAAMPACRLVVAGAGSAEPEVRRRVAAMRAGARVSMIGRVERGRVPEVMRRSTVYCLPSHGEPFGMSALEAMACGKPVVVSDAGGLAHFVPERGGRKVPVGDAPALARALLEVLGDTRLQRAMGAYNRREVEEVYSWTRVIDRLESIYHGTLAPSALGAPRVLAAS